MIDMQGVLWEREWPAVRDRDAVYKKYPAGRFFIKRLSPETLWLRLPDFDDKNATLLRNLIEENARALATTDNLIIDLRNNEGGSDFVYAPIIPYLYTRPIYEIGMEFRATHRNIALRRDFLDRLRGNAQADGLVRELEAQINVMSKSIGNFVQPDALPFVITRLDDVRPSPRRIALLIDNAGSSGEQFVLAARQSRKVTLFGKDNSAGILDYANVVSMPSPSGRYGLYWATSRSLRLPADPVDGEGIPPDIRIPPSESDPVSYAQRWLEQQVD